MIIDCLSCNKKFDIDENLIPEKGRLVQCSSCNHKWFFKKEIAVKTIEPIANESFKVFESNNSQGNNTTDGDNGTNIQDKIAIPTEKIVKKVETNKIKIIKKNNLLNLTIVFIISFIALIILADTFKNPLGKIVPNLEFLLYNLYECIKDIELFIKDLI